ncbi:MAG TPA: hypothetical protein VF092_05605 [Longimicrobium sp.]
MPTHRTRAKPVLAAALILVAAAFATVTRPAQPDRDAAAARRAFDHFLRGSLEQPGWVPVDTAWAEVVDDCGWKDDNRTNRMYWMARYRIVSVRVHGDRGTGVADVLAAAEQVPDPVLYGRVTLRVAHHVLRFPLRRDGARKWRVCPVSESGWQLGHDIVPHNIGIDEDLVFATIDSIRGVPHRRWFDFPR